MTTSRTGTNTWKQTRARVLARSTICHLCGKAGADEVDHVVPHVLGGTDDESNLAPAHMRCNRSKGARTGNESRAPRWAFGGSPDPSVPFRDPHHSREW